MASKAERLNTLRLDLIANESLWSDQDKIYWDLKGKESGAYDDYIGAPPNSTERKGKKKIYNEIVTGMNNAVSAMIIINNIIDSINAKITALESEPDDNNAPGNDKQKGSLDPRKSGFDNINHADGYGNHQTPQSRANGVNINPPSQPAQGLQPNSLLVTRNDTQPVNTLAPPAPAISEQEAQDARERKKLKNLYPSMSKPKLPPLVRRDGQELSTAEKMYPAMGYNEDEYEPWSDDAVAMAITKIRTWRKMSPSPGGLQQLIHFRSPRRTKRNSLCRAIQPWQIWRDTINRNERNSGNLI
jgi:hypothetical protein